MKTIIIAEAGVNHNGELAIAKQLVDVAAEAGVDYVKFQTFKAEKLVSKAAQKASYQKENLGGGDDSQFNMLKKLELSEEMHQELIAHCARKSVKFLSTGFDLDSLNYLNELNIDFFKIPSGEITNRPYLEQIGQYKKEVILSTGMADLSEIKEAIKVLCEAGTKRDEITVLHCNTEYPTPYADVNLNAMQSIGKALGIKVGYSDHTQGIEVPVAAVALGATVIEKHFTLDKTMEGPDHKASLEPNELKSMVKAIRNIESAMGDGIKKQSPSEIKNISIARKSIHIAMPIESGIVIKTEHLLMKRPGDGISPMYIDKVIGKKIKMNLKADHKLLWEDLI